MAASTKPFGPEVLRFDAAAEADRICKTIREQVGKLRRRGAVVGISGGIDSSVVTGLCTRALGVKNVQGLFMPERDSSEETLKMSRLVAEAFGIPAELEDITGLLDAAGCYRRRDDAIRLVAPDYGPGHKAKIVLPSVLETTGYNVYSVVIRDPQGQESKVRLNAQAMLGIVAATNFKQRVRKMLEYYYADRLNFVVAGTPNRLEYDQGFFVKLGDGAADIKPIAHLYKTQVYAMAEYLGVPAEVRRRPPTTDTYPLEQGQDEFYFSLPYAKMDLVLYGKNHGYAPEDVAPVVELTPQQVEYVYADIDRKRSTTQYLHAQPLLVESIQELPKLS